MDTRRVIGNIRRGDGSAWAGARIRATLSNGSYLDDADGTQILVAEVVGTIDANGDIRGADGVLGLPLFVNSTGVIATEWEMDDPSIEDAYFITVAAGEGSYSLSDARAAYSGPAGLTATAAYAYDAPSGRHEGKPAASRVVMEFLPVREFSIPAGMEGSRLLARTAATAQTVLSVQKNDVEFGTITVAAAGTTGTFATTTATTFDEDDVLTVVAPANQDATFADFSITLKGTLA